MPVIPQTNQEDHHRFSIHSACHPEIHPIALADHRRGLARAAEDCEVARWPIDTVLAHHPVH
ncbi:MAG: hypothetical protein ABL904_23470, partial [Hyphomicrobiaceae bacterium]